MGTILPTNLPVFIVASLVLILTPGPAVMYIIARSVNHGRKAGLASVLGVEVGNSVHVIAATLGLSAILLTSALAFNIVKFVGAAYLIYLGIRTLRTPVTVDSTDPETPKNLQRVFSQGVIVAILNPKTALFFLAFLPQFVDMSKGNVSLQFFLLGFIFVAMATVSDSLYAILSGTVGSWLRHNIWFTRFQRYFAGTIYIGLGLTAAFANIKD